MPLRTFLETLLQDLRYAWPSMVTIRPGRTRCGRRGPRLWTLAGAFLGLAGVLFATRALRSMLFEVSEHDALTFLIALLGLAATAFTAAWLPSRRASQVDPMTALRHE